MVRGDSYGKSSVYIVSSTIYRKKGKMEGKRGYEQGERFEGNERDFIKIIIIMIANEVCQLVHHLKACTYMYMLDHAHKCEYNTLAGNYPMQDAPIRMHFNRQNNECTTSLLLNPSSLLVYCIAQEL